MGDVAPGTAAAAEAAAARAAAEAGVKVVEATDLDAIKAACRLLDDTWSRVCAPPELCVAIRHAGGYVAMATAGEEVVGASVAFLGSVHGHLLLHSHVTAVAARLRGGGVGFAVKEHQRAWCLARGVDLAAWTFDPLRRANAWFNVVKLGAGAVALHEDLYGPMDDAFNAGDLTDRLEVRWELASPAAVAAAAGASRPADDGALVAAGAVVVLDAGPGDEPVTGPPAPPGAVRLVAVPADPGGLAADPDHPAGRRAWRLALRGALRPAFDAGLVVTGFTAGGRYVLSAPTSPGAGTRPSL